MSYKTIVAKNTIGTSGFLTDLWAFLSDIGWTLHDNQDGSNYRVYKCPSDGTQAPVYVRIAFDGASAYDGGGGTDPNYIYFSAYHYWDATGHSGTGRAVRYSVDTRIYTSSGSGWFYWLYGDESMLLVISSVAGSYYGVLMGFVSDPIWNTNTTTTAQASAGSDVAISVADETGFVTGREYQIVGIAGEGRERVTVDAVSSGQITVSYLAATYASGAYIGETPSTFAISNGDDLSIMRMANNWFASGTEDNGTANLEIENPLTNKAGTLIPDDDQTDRSYITDMFAFEYDILDDDGMGDDIGILGQFHPNLKLVDTDLYTGEDILYPDELDSGQSSGSNTSSTLNDTSKSWTTDEHVDKFVIIYGGTGYSQIRKISANTGTELTIVGSWTEVPDATSYYRIVDYAYRYFDFGIFEIGIREGSDV
ncbi:MAG: hypothetical protein SVK08_01615 [Halobacteriota archaeon]|nr:hypothetical protein [Halobacteriota archaeon]